MTVLFSAGLQLPVMPCSDVVGSGLRGSPSQMGATELNNGRTFGLTVMVMVLVVAHCPAVGVKV